MLVPQLFPGVLVLLGAGVGAALDDFLWVLETKTMVNIVQEPSDVRDISGKPILELLPDVSVVARQLIPYRQHRDTVRQQPLEMSVQGACGQMLLQPVPPSFCPVLQFLQYVHQSWDLNLGRRLCCCLVLRRHLLGYG